ncbi:hypothetical protein NLJ89_g10208 [Agrocybe chaxingu]|uniref:Uncharacterized protein n=1 Tax=Agrocybe chaxingu TaxID=84603 RepID=A0A9W8MSC6_9AGAR|nr:hypothetical protein NLJ89_g10208 [Agrocybe chaxingu]
MFSALFKNSEEYRLRTRLQGSTSPINCLAFTADGKLLASGGDDESIRIWDIEGKGEHIIIFGLESGVMISKLAATGADNWIKNLKTSVGGACLSIDQNLLLVDNLVKGFDVYSYPHTSPSDSFTIKRGKTYLQDSVFLEDGSSIGCGSDHGKIYLYSLETTKCVQTLKHGSKITMVQALDACSNNNYHLIASGTTEKRPKIHIWEKSSGPKRQRERDHGCNWVFLLVILNLSVLVAVVVALAGDEGQQYLLQGSKFFTVEGGFRALPTVVVQPRHSEPSELKKLSDAVYQRAKEGMMKRGVDLEDPEWRQRLEESL